MPAILTEQLTKHFPPDIKAVDGIDLSIAEGKIFAFLGQNGSGKTTTVRMLTTLLRPTSGRAQVDGLDCWRGPRRSAGGSVSRFRRRHSTTCRRAASCWYSRHACMECLPAR